MNAQEIKQLTGAKSKAEGINILYDRLAARKWSLGGMKARLAGYDQKTKLVHFTQTESKDGGCWHRRVYVTLPDALDCISGNLTYGLLTHRSMT